MRFSKTLIPTLRETPAEAEAASHKLLLRAGYIRRLASGLYIYLPLFRRVMDRINRIIREEMEAIGAQEMLMPVLHPAEVWQQTGRWETIGEEMFRLKDRTGRDMCLGMTHEEIMTWLAAREIRSYRNLPQIWFQIQTKLRDEARPKSGILRTREFIMKDSYSFDRDEEALDYSYRLHEEAYHRIFSRCGLEFYQVESDPGMMGGATAHEFMAPSPAGEDDVAICDSCGYMANVELAKSLSPDIGSDDWEYKEIHTPDRKTVREVSEFLGVNPSSFIKSLLYISGDGPVLVLIRGDQELQENKLQMITGPFRQALREEVIDILGVEPGFIGPMNHGVRIIADEALKEGVYISGANKKDYHAKGLRPGIHFEAQWHDLHIVRTGDRCTNCSAPLRVERVIEIGNIFKLGTKYSKPLKACYLDENGKELPIVMGSYGIGPARVAAAAVEQNYDDDGIIWPRSISPLDVIVLPLNMNDPKTGEISEQLYTDLRKHGLKVLLDDRPERAGVKFKDSDLIGLPTQVIIGERGLREGVIEIKDRRTKEKSLVRVEEALQKIIKTVKT
ncbi:proline--tRNA ligase [bacterium BMS3Bbin06]|nr:proline--tRNA ligase [bacterium BMS3Abin08]GBE34317.1 proline--tRNA ligase [bacterium BMS3Bbin06]HDO34963.1 proline--tRNA ligase [Nitrospirota bacterium]HDY71296.1 proline--tRNA ligase [Nitrospirota bacterium]